MGVYRRPDSRYWWIWLDGSTPPIRFCSRIVIGSKHAQRESYAEAEDIYRAAMGDLARGVFELPTARPARTFREHAEWYREHITPTHRGHVRERSMIGKLMAYFGDTLLTALDCEAWKFARAKQVKPSTVNRELDILKAMLRAAVPMYLKTNPATPVKKFRVREVPIRLLSREDETKIAAKATKDEWAFVLLGLDALLRCGDARRLHERDDHGAYLELGDSKVDTYKVPVSKRLRAALNKLTPKEGWYFPRKYRSTWAPMNPNTAFLLFRDLCVRAKVPHGRPNGVTYHGLRHTGATRAAKVIKLRAVQKLGGWKSLRQLERYDHPDSPELLAGVEAIGSRSTHAAKRTPRKRQQKRRSA